MSEFDRDYLIFVFLFGVGAIQIAASLGRLRGLLLFYNTDVSRLAGASIILAAIVWFFASEPRNINDVYGGLDGNVQAKFFAIGSFAAIVVTLLVSSLLNARMRGGIDHIIQLRGLEALKESNYVVALTRSISYWWKRWRQ